MFGFQSPDPVPTQEVADIICANTKFGPNVSMLIARFVRDNPEHWDRKELSKYLKKRGLKKIAKRVKKEKISAENVSSNDFMSLKIASIFVTFEF